MSVNRTEKPQFPNQPTTHDSVINLALSSIDRRTFTAFSLTGSVINPNLLLASSPIGPENLSHFGVRDLINMLFDDNFLPDSTRFLSRLVAGTSDNHIQFIELLRLPDVADLRDIEVKSNKAIETHIERIQEIGRILISRLEDKPTIANQVTNEINFESEETASLSESSQASTPKIEAKDIRKLVEERTTLYRESMLFDTTRQHQVLYQSLHSLIDRYAKEVLGAKNLGLFASEEQKRTLILDYLNEQIAEFLQDGTSKIQIEDRETALKSLTVKTLISIWQKNILDPDGQIIAPPCLSDLVTQVATEKMVKAINFYHQQARERARDTQIREELRRNGISEDNKLPYEYRERIIKVLNKEFPAFKFTFETQHHSKVNHLQFSAKVAYLSSKTQESLTNAINDLLNPKLIFDLEDSPEPTRQDITFKIEDVFRSNRIEIHNLSEVNLFPNRVVVPLGIQVPTLQELTLPGHAAFNLYLTITNKYKLEDQLKEAADNDPILQEYFDVPYLDCEATTKALEAYRTFKRLSYSAINTEARPK